MIIKVTKRPNQLFDKIIYISGEKIYDNTSTYLRTEINKSQ